MNQPTIDRIMVGRPQIFGQKGSKRPMDREWRSGIVKHVVKGKIWAGRTNLQGDGQADLKHYCGPQKAIFAYPISHYAYWQKKLQRTDFAVGAFGENYKRVQGKGDSDIRKRVIGPNE